MEDGFKTPGRGRQRFGPKKAIHINPITEGDDI
jgi:hypothetical protein